MDADKKKTKKLKKLENRIKESYPKKKESNKTSDRSEQQINNNRYTISSSRKQNS